MNQKPSILFLLVVLLILSLFPLSESFAFNASMITVSCDRWPDSSSLKRFGDDCVRIAGAQINEEKAIAVWRFIQQITEAGCQNKIWACQALYHAAGSASFHVMVQVLNHWDEDFRGAAAVALGKMGDTNAIPKLQELMQREPFPWVLSAVKEIVQRLETLRESLE